MPYAVCGHCASEACPGCRVLKRGAGRDTLLALLAGRRVGVAGCVKGRNPTSKIKGSGSTAVRAAGGSGKVPSAASGSRAWRLQCASTGVFHTCLMSLFVGDDREQRERAEVCSTVFRTSTRGVLRPQCKCGAVFS